MVEYFDERCTECIKDINGELDIAENCHYLNYIQVYYTNWNCLKDVRLSEIYYALGMPFPNNYLIDYKLKKNQPAFEFKFDEKLNKIVLEIDVPDQPVLRDLGNAFEYTYPCDPKKKVEYTFTFKKED